MLLALRNIFTPVPATGDLVQTQNKKKPEKNRILYIYKHQFHIIKLLRHALTVD